MTPDPLVRWSAVRLDEGLTRRLAELARCCDVPAEAVALTGTALLLRRYTGRPTHPVRWCDRAAGADVTVRLDLADDGPVALVLGWGAAAIRAALPDSLTRAGSSSSRARRSEPDAGPFADPLPVALRLAGPACEIAIGDCPSELVDPVTEDLASLLHAMAQEGRRSTADLLPESAYERRRPVRRVPGGGCDLESYATIPAAFAAQVARHPERPAVLADDASLTYRELGAAVAATAAAIQAATAGASRAAAAGPASAGRAALLCRHGASTVTALLAALSTGRAYVPLDPTFPDQRLAQILADSQADVLVTDAAHADHAERLIGLADRAGTATVRVAPGDGAPGLDALRGTAGPDDPAYLLYTSGSTGTPKGVVQSHRAVLASVAVQVRGFAITPADRTSVLTSFGYDMAVTDLFSAILSGAAAVPVDVRAHGLGHLAHTLAERRVTIYHSTPTVYRYLLASLGEGKTLPDIRAVLLGGEEVTRHDVALARRRFGPDTVFVNGYGTTEISFAAQYHLPPDAPVDEAVVPIGHPLDGIDVVLLDRAGRPTCLTGEILVRSARVAMGYWGRPELTAGRFVEHRGVRAYLTGDLARRLPDGRLVFLGRADRLVKIRGHRVELGEVEARLAALPGVGQAAVVARPRAGGTGPGDKEIIGYVVPAHGATADPAALRAALAVTLPDFMIPRAVLTVAALPMGATGKLDADALPPPPAPATTVDGGDPLERLIGQAWCEALGIPRVDRNTTFVELGGHSLLMAMVQQRLETALDRRLPLTRLFEFPTVAGLAAHLRAGAPAGSGATAAAGALARAADRMSRRRARRAGGSSGGGDE